MNDSVKLHKIINLIQEQYTEMYNCSKADQEYTSLGGNGCDSGEALAAFTPIYQKVMRIANLKVKKSMSKNKLKLLKAEPEDEHPPHCSCPEYMDGFHRPNCPWNAR